MIDAALPDLKGIAAMYIFPKFVDIKTATARGVPVTGVPNMLVETTAEFTFALLITTAWRLPEQERVLRERQWKQYQSMAMLGTRIYDKTLGIVGLGKIGTSLAKKAQGSGMRVIYNKRTRLSPAEETRLNVEWRETEDLFREADFVALTPTLTPDSKGLVGERLLSLMKPTSILINTSRGAVVDERALAAALQEKRIRGAGLDVFERELPYPDPGPLPALLDLPNVVVIAPHRKRRHRDARGDGHQNGRQHRSDDPGEAAAGPAQPRGPGGGAARYRGPDRIAAARGNPPVRRHLAGQVRRRSSTVISLTYFEQP